MPDKRYDGHSKKIVDEFGMNMPMDSAREQMGISARKTVTSPINSPAA